MAHLQSTISKQVQESIDSKFARITDELVSKAIDEAVLRHREVLDKIAELMMRRLTVSLEELMGEER